MLLLGLFTKFNFFKTKFQEHYQVSNTIKCQTVWIQIRTNVLFRTDVLLVLIWVQVVCKGYQQMKKVEKERG